MRKVEARAALSNDIMLWRAIRDGSEPLVLEDKLGRICELFKSDGCTDCPMVAVGQACGRTESTWTAYFKLIVLCQRRGLVGKTPECFSGFSTGFSNGVLEKEIDEILYSTVIQLVSDLEDALKHWE